MKALIILSLTIVSLNAFASDSKKEAVVGENKSAEGICPALRGADKREAKIVVEPEQEEKQAQKPAGTISV